MLCFYVEMSASLRCIANRFHGEFRAYTFTASSQLFGSMCDVTNAFL